MSAMQPAVGERRRSRRHSHSSETILFRFENEQGRPRQARGRLENISENGAAIRAATAPPVNTVGEISIEFQGFQFVAESRVVRATPRGFAVEFTDVDEMLLDSMNDLRVPVSDDDES